jgi:hypothetical protein
METDNYEYLHSRSLSNFFISPVTPNFLSATLTIPSATLTIPSATLTYPFGYPD